MENPSFCSVIFPFKPPVSWCSHMFSRLSQHFSCCHSFPIKPSSCFLDFPCFSPRTSGGPSFDWAATHQSFTVPSCSPQKGLKSLGLESNWLCLKLGKPRTWWFLIMFIDVHWCSLMFIEVHSISPWKLLSLGCIPPVWDKPSSGN
jgi:hypothetical protein